jgi:nucleoside-diphosphate-sugar epimerase
MRVLYIGGTGEISKACVSRSVEIGHEVTVFNRGRRKETLAEDVEHVIGDLRDEEAYGRLPARGFDVVCQFLAYDTETVRRDMNLFSDHCAQYVFVSTASAYQKPRCDELITEDTPLVNPHWAYSRSKAACESLLSGASEEGRLPTTIVRPSHTYRTRFPSTVIDGDHLAWRILRSRPVVVHDKGESLWTLTHAGDFARAFTLLLGNPESLGREFHITSDDALPWNGILDAVGQTLGRKPEICPVPVKALLGYNPKWEGPLLGDKANSMRFDNRAVRSVVGPWECEVTLGDGLSRVSEHVETRLRGGYEPDAALDVLIDGIVADHLG